jgi:hypothetical protein
MCGPTQWLWGRQGKEVRTMAHNGVPVHFAPSEGDLLCGMWKYLAEWTSENNEVTCGECRKRMATSGTRESKEEHDNKR